MRRWPACRTASIQCSRRRASLARWGGTAVTPQSAADVAAPAAAGAPEINSASQPWPELLGGRAGAFVPGRIAAPPTTRTALGGAPAVLGQARPRPADGKT